MNWQSIRLRWRLIWRLTQENLRRRAVPYVVLMFLTAIFSMFLSIPALYQGVIADSVRSSLAGHEYSIQLSNNATDVSRRHPELRPTQSEAGSIRGGSGLSDTTLSSSSDQDYVRDYGVTVAGMGPTGPGDVAVSRAVAETLGSDLGDAVKITTESGREIEGTISRVFLLPAEPSLRVVAATMPVLDHDSVIFTSVEDPFGGLLTADEVEDVSVSGRAAFTVMQLTDETVPPRALLVAAYGSAVLALVAFAWTVAVAVAGRAVVKEALSGLMRAGSSEEDARLVVGGAAVTSCLSCIAIGALTAMITLWAAAPYIGSSVGQEWLRTRVWSTAMITGSTIGWFIMLIAVLAATSLTAALLPSLHANARVSRAAWAAVGLVLVAGGLVMLWYLWHTDGPVEGWFTVGALAPAVLATGVSVLASVLLLRRYGSESSGWAGLQRYVVNSSLPMTILCVTASAGVSGASGYLVSESVWSTRANPSLVAGGYIEFASVNERQLEAIQGLARRHPSLATSAAQQSPRFKVLATRPSVADCYEDLVGADITSDPCYDRTLGTSQMFQPNADLARGADGSVRSAPQIIEGGRIALVVLSADNLVNQVVIRDAVPDVGLGGVYLPVATVPEDDPVALDGGLVRRDVYSVRVAGIDTIARKDYLALRGQMALLASTSIFFEDLGSDDGGSYFAGVILAALGALLGAGSLFALVHLFVQNRRDWWPLFLNLQVGRMPRIAVVLSCLGPLMAGGLVGLAAAACAVTWMVDASPLLDSRLIFAIPGLVVLAAALALFGRLVKPTQ